MERIRRERKLVGRNALTVGYLINRIGTEAQSPAVERTFLQIERIHPRRIGVAELLTRTPMIGQNVVTGFAVDSFLGFHAVVNGCRRDDAGAAILSRWTTRARTTAHRIAGALPQHTRKMDALRDGRHVDASPCLELNATSRCTADVLGGFEGAFNEWSRRCRIAHVGDLRLDLVKAVVVARESSFESDERHRRVTRQAKVSDSTALRHPIVRVDQRPRAKTVLPRSDE